MRVVTDGLHVVERPTAVIADDERSARLLVRSALEALDIEVVEEVATGVEAIRACAMHEPDVVVLDQMMPGLAGHEAVRAMLATSPRSRVVIYTSIDAPTLEGQLLAEGAAAVVSKLAPIDELMAVLRGLARSGSPR